MRFIVDECVGPTIARWLETQGHDVYSVFDQARDATDETVMSIAIDEQRVLIASDKDFGEKAYREKPLHSGIILLRLADQSVAAKMAAIERLLAVHSDRVEGSFVVVTEKQIRFAKAQRLTLDK